MALHVAGKSPLSQHLHSWREIRIRETLLKQEKTRKKNATVANKLISDFHFVPAALPPHVCGEAERRCWGLNYQGLFGVVLRAVCLAGSAAFLLSVNGPKCAGFRYTEEATFHTRLLVLPQPRAKDLLPRTKNTRQRAPSVPADDGSLPLAPVLSAISEVTCTP